MHKYSNGFPHSNIQEAHESVILYMVRKLLSIPRGNQENEKQYLYHSRGMMTSAERLNVASNNVANANTNGYKSDISFEQAIKFLEEGPYPGKDQPVLGGTAIDMEQGVIDTTGRALDMAFEGPGFFTIQGPDNQPMYTRNGAFNLNSQKELVTHEGMNVLDKFDRKIAIFGDKFEVTPKGDIFVDDNYYTSLKIVDFKNRDEMEKVGSTFFKAKDSTQPPAPMETPQVVSGALEKSNFNLLKGLAELSAAERSFEFQRTAADIMLRTLRRVITEIPRPI